MEVLKSKVALVTGAGSGIGKCVVEGCAKNSASGVVILTKHLSQQEMQALVSLHPIGGLGKPEEVAELGL
jgi:NAD(P)-dependent dehydrogenase (short-subunit alcohol dehydrogenase family)